MSLPRASGVLLHPTSLPSRFGIGDLGSEAYQFADLLTSTGQHLWQLLPLGPTGYANPPYQCLSAFTGNPLLASPERLVVDKALESAHLENAPSFTEDRADYSAVIRFKMPPLKKSFDTSDEKLLSIGETNSKSSVGKVPLGSKLTRCLRHRKRLAISAPGIHGRKTYERASRNPRSTGARSWIIKSSTTNTHKTSSSNSGLS
jgi:hypothetical protein